MNLIVIKKDLVGPQSPENFNPLHHPRTEILVREVHPFHTNCKLLLIAGWRVENNVEEVGRSLTSVLHQGDGYRSTV